MEALECCIREVFTLLSGECEFKSNNATAVPGPGVKGEKLAMHSHECFRGGEYWIHVSWRKHMFAFSIPRWELLFDGGELVGGWDLADG